MDGATRIRLTRASFNLPTLRVARDLLGKFIVRRHRGRELAAMITEVEAYKGPRDRAAHTFGGRRTARVDSATPISPELAASIKNNLTRIYGQGLIFSFAENATLIGGLRVRVGSDVYDSSIQSSLERLAGSF